LVSIFFFNTLVSVPPKAERKASTNPGLSAVAETVPADFVLMACRLAALQVATILRATTPSYSIEDIRQNAALTQAWLDKLKSGTPLAVPPTDRTPGVAEMGARSFKRNPGRGWRTDGL
jgi:hypothetical protein